MSEPIKIALIQVVASTLKPGKRSLRTLGGGDVRDVLADFLPGECVVIMRESDFDRHVLGIR